EEVPVREDEQGLERSQLDGGVKVHEVRRTDERRLAEVGAAREERVEGLQGVGARIAIAARYVGLEPKSWIERDGKREARIGSGRPRLDPALVEGAELVERLD